MRLTGCCRLCQGACTGEAQCMFVRAHILSLLFPSHIRFLFPQKRGYRSKSRCEAKMSLSSKRCQSKREDKYLFGRFPRNVSLTCNRLLVSLHFRDVNTTIMEMLIMVYACRTSCAKSITGVLPYFPYSKQCKMRKRGSIVSKLVASMMCKAGESVPLKHSRRRQDTIQCHISQYFKYMICTNHRHVTS